ncbi:MAG: hypothetical protein PHF75_03940, partial [Gallionella sp.]|nr:hypothetical protein [Gallionella sp.]
LLLAERYGFNTALLVDGVLGLRYNSEWRRSVEDGAQFIDKQGVSWRSLAVVELVEQPEFLQIGI